VAEEPAANAEDDVDPVRVLSQGSRWVVDYGGGITRRFESRDEAIAHAQALADNEGRELLLP
jgi:hypothetical protein